MSGSYHIIYSDALSTGSNDPLETVDFQNFVDGLIDAGEGLVTFSWDSVAGHPTAGYGYDIFEQSGNLIDDFSNSSGGGNYGLSLDQIAELQLIDNEIEGGQATLAKSQFDSDFANNQNLPVMTPTQAQQLVEDVRQRDLKDLGYLLDGQLENTRELAVLEDMYYNGGTNLVSSGDKLVAAIDSNNRADAWFEIRFDSDGNNLPSIAARRYLESQVFDLYGSDVDSSGNGTPTTAAFTSLGNFKALSEIGQIFQMYATDRSSIVSYDETNGDQVASANSNYSSFLSGEGNGLQVLTTDAAFMPAFDYLSSTFAEGVYIPGDPNDPNLEAQHQGELSLDQFNVYVDPGNQRSDIIVSDKDPAYSGNYIIIGNTTTPTQGQILQGITTAGVTNVIIAPDGGDSIDPGSAKDVVWGAPSATDQGSVLDLSGQEPGC